MGARAAAHQGSAIALAAIALGAAGPARAERDARPARAAASGAAAGCAAELAARGVAAAPAARPGIALGVQIAGPLGGVQYSSPSGALVIDCSLAVSLADAGAYLRGLGIDRVMFSSAYSRRMVRGTNRLSKHSYGLAIDIHAVAGPELGALRVDQDYEQGLGDAIDCLGQPLTQGGAVLKLMQCQLARSGLFSLVLSPDYDDAHHDHFHLEVIPWAARGAIRSGRAALH
jgi:hypothetical protein